MSWVQAIPWQRKAADLPSPVVIRALSDEHIPLVLAACEDWQQLSQYGPPYWRPRSPAELRRKIASTSGPQPGAEYTFVLARGAGKLLGECSVHAIDWRSRCAQVGVCIWSPTDRRQGIGHAAVDQLVEWAISYLGLARLEAWIVEGNESSINLFRSLGFEYEGTLRGRYLHAGTRQNMQVWALLSAA
ncbi:GNAT family N-acetyltransferase [Mycobacterium sp. BMJ-28]